MKTIEHIKKSKKRTGKYYGELHYWMDERINPIGVVTGGRFSDTHTKESFDYIRKKWGEEAVEEARQHLIDDHIIEDFSHKNKKPNMDGWNAPQKGELMLKPLDKRRIAFRRKNGTSRVNIKTRN